MTLLLIIAAAQSVLADVPQRNVDKALSKARPVATCMAGPDCDARWAKARNWVVANSRFTLLRDNDHQILTRFAIYASTDASYAVALDAPVNGIRTIRFRAWCGNFISCIPKTETLTALFVQAVNAP